MPMARRNRYDIAMNRLFTVVTLAACVALLSAVRLNAQDDTFLEIYTLIQDAKAISASRPAEAMSKYRAAQDQLQRLQRLYPDWNSSIVDYRLKSVAAEIAELAKNPAAARAAASTNNVASIPLPQRSAAELEAEVSSLQNQIRQMQNDRSLMESKLKEALAARPAALDPRELARAEEQLREAAKENELLKVRLAEKAKEVAPAEASETDDMKRQLASAERRIAEQASQLAALGVERDVLQKQVQQQPADATTLALLKAENELLKRQAAASANASSTTRAPQSGTSEDLTHQLAEARAQVAALQSEKEILRLERIALESRLKQISNAPVTSVSGAAPAAESDALKQLQRERDDLRRQLESAQNELYGRNSRNTASKVEELTGMLQILRTRLSVLDVQRVPYTKEELALLEKPKPGLDPARATSRPVSELPAGVAALVAEAQRDFAARRFSDAEAKYKQVLDRDDKNVATLGNLAAIQIEMGRLDDAERNIRKSLQLDPEDSYSLSLLGSLQYRQEKFDEALDTLAHAARVDPRNAEVQNYLGLTLSQKGMRNAAESAFRKAIELNPNYTGAHYNLAVAYLTQKPPSIELGRFHYQKAIDAGMQRNEEVERLLNRTSASDAPRTPAQP